MQRNEQLVEQVKTLQQQVRTATAQSERYLEERRQLEVQLQNQIGEYQKLLRGEEKRRADYLNQLDAVC